MRQWRRERGRWRELHTIAKQKSRGIAKQKSRGRSTLVAALDVLEGRITGRCIHRHQEFIRFLDAIEAEVPAGKMVHDPQAPGFAQAARRS